MRCLQSQQSKITSTRYGILSGGHVELSEHALGDVDLRSEPEFGDFLGSDLHPGQDHLSGGLHCAYVRPHRSRRPAGFGDGPVGCCRLRCGGRRHHALGRRLVIRIICRAVARCRTRSPGPDERTIDHHGIGRDLKLSALRCRLDAVWDCQRTGQGNSAHHLDHDHHWWDRRMVGTASTGRKFHSEWRSRSWASGL